jgi:hypothetical protein
VSGAVSSGPSAPLPTRLPWPRLPARPALASPLEMLPTVSRAPASCWQSRLAAGADGAVRGSDLWLPLRTADLHRLRRRAHRRLIAFVVTVTSLMVAGVGQHRANLIANLSNDLYAQRMHSITMRDSLAVIRAALDSRVERFVALQPRPRDSIALPIAGRVSSGFSPTRLHPELRVWRPHRGIDIPAPSGTPVRALVEGRVHAVRRDFGYGLYIEVDHGKGIRTRYAHLKSAAVRSGQHVTPETVLGAVGSSGMASAPHLHYELLQFDRWLDPLRYALTVVEVVPATIRRFASQARGPLQASSMSSADTPAFEVARLPFSAIGCTGFLSSCVRDSVSGAPVVSP